jgi:general L-amino acid transport system permease protein
MKAKMRWAKENLFNGFFNSAISISLITFFLWFFYKFFNWLVIDSVLIGDANTCRQASGACLAFIVDKSRFIFFGFYPETEIWRPIIAIIIFFVIIFYSRLKSRWNRRLLYNWAYCFFIIWLLMRGGYFGLTKVETHNWGGLPLTLMLAIVGMIFSYPIGIFLALGRQSKLPLIKYLCVAYIEMIRGVPLISMLFMASVMMPLFLPEGYSPDKLMRAQAAIIMFISAYMAEVVRGGLQAIPKGQYEAADAIGLTYWQKMRLVILPQALKIVIPPTVNTAIGMFKDTSLVIIIALFDLMYTTKASMQDSNWLGFSVEAYLFVALIYFIFCNMISRMGRLFEKEFGV